MAISSYQRPRSMILSIRLHIFTGKMVHYVGRYDGFCYIFYNTILCFVTILLDNKFNNSPSIFFLISVHRSHNVLGQRLMDPKSEMTFEVTKYKEHTICKFTFTPFVIVSFCNSKIMLSYLFNQEYVKYCLFSVHRFSSFIVLTSNANRRLTINQRKKKQFTKVMSFCW